MQLQATLRTITGKQVNAYRKKDMIPGVLYGKHLSEPISIFFEKNPFLKVYKECGRSLPLEIVGDGINQLVLIHTIDLHPVYTTLSHVDFLVVKKWEAVHAHVELRFVGQSPVDKNKTGRVNQLLSSLEVVADPTKLPKYIDVDMTALENVHDVLFIKDLILPEWVKVVQDAEQPVVTVVSLGDENEWAGDSENAAGVIPEESAAGKETKE